MIVHDAPQGSDAWRQARAGIATASRFADVLATIKSGEAAARRNYRAQLVVERLTGRMVDGFETASMRQGTEREPAAREAYMVRTGRIVEQVGFIRHDTMLCGASADGLIDDDGATEIKCPEIAAHLEYLLRADAPPQYMAQVQGVLWITERRFCDFVSWNPDFPDHLQLVIRRVYPDPTYIAGLKLAVKLFMAEVLVDEAALRALPRMDEVAA